MRIVAAMSGGVDSSVAAFLLKQKGYDVIGITIKTWPKEECGESGERLCCSLEAVQFARSVAEEIGIPFYVLDFSKEFDDMVKKYFIREYASGRTPNPCVYCNSKIKFGYLLEKARELGAEKVATGHYACILDNGAQHYLAEAKDKKRDQSYFLYDIPKENLSCIEFPVGVFTKEEVRNIAKQEKLMTAERPSSQDICFVTTNGGYREYLSKFNKDAFLPGDILNTKGEKIGSHKGIASYTVGQRKGIGLAGKEPFYVLNIDMKKNTITIGSKLGAMNKKICVKSCNWLMFDRLEGEKKFYTRIRYNGPKILANVSPSSDEDVIVEFTEKQFAPTPGQAAVFYDGENVAGGGWIEEVLE